MATVLAVVVFMCVFVSISLAAVPHFRGPVTWVGRNGDDDDYSVNYNKKVKLIYLCI
jgi:hypothetical protein